LIYNHDVALQPISALVFTKSTSHTRPPGLGTVSLALQALRRREGTRVTDSVLRQCENQPTHQEPRKPTVAEASATTRWVQSPVSPESDQPKSNKSQHVRRFGTCSNTFNFPPTPTSVTLGERQTAMSDFTLNGSAVGALALSCAYLLVHTVGETRKVRGHSVFASEDSSLNHYPRQARPYSKRRIQWSSIILHFGAATSLGSTRLLT
jgi:hypothetical protein